jgi:predicted metal-dependent phosphoesterase TrpH
VKRFAVDLHIHTCLSPCAEWEMSPRNIVRQSRRVGLDIIAVCDHNSMENAEAVSMAAKGTGLVVMTGMEICSREEAHVLAIFGQTVQAREMQACVYAALPGENAPRVWGYQVLADADDHVLGENPRLLIGATQLTLHQIVEKAHELNGLAIASHIDRPAFSVIGQLGFIPPDLQLDGVEVSRHTDPASARQTLTGIDRFPCLASSDAHLLKDIGTARTVFRMKTPDFDELRSALSGRDGRTVEA